MQSIEKNVFFSTLIKGMAMGCTGLAWAHPNHPMCTGLYFSQNVSEQSSATSGTGPVLSSHYCLLYLEVTALLSERLQQNPPCCPQA